MFFPEESITENLICSFCNQHYDCPTVLPCGYSICKHHLTDALAVLPCNVQEFTCLLCQEVHDLPKNNIFPENKTML